ncbi:MAG TPA: CotH kinase family protein [Candidatus Acidoferrum sp.]|nr:CotH kinase family protein [Candidatus Acidoferrum sp.]
MKFPLLSFWWVIGKFPVPVLLVAFSLSSLKLSAASTNLTWQAVGISEFMATNVTTAVDADGDPSPWIEIYNPTASDVNLSGWSLTTNANNLRQWIFPNVVLLDAGDASGSDNFMVVFASGKNRTNNLAELHTNFRLPVNGGYLALADSQTNIVSVYTNFPAQLPDVAYGRDLFNPNFAGYFPAPTPGEANLIAGTNFSPPVIFSRPGGTFTASFTLQLSTASNNATIHYTLNGSVPTSDSATYASPLSITGFGQVRARAFGAGLLPGPVHSETYLKLDSGLSKTNSNLPAMVLYNFGEANIPTDDTYGSTNQLVNVSLYEPVNGNTSLTNIPTLTARAGFHIRGSSTEYIAKHAFSVEFWDDLNNSADYSPLGLPAESDFVLYAPNNFEPVLIHNPLIYQLSNEIGRYAPRTRLVEVYLVTNAGPVTATNYNGIYVLEEKIKWDANRVDIDKIHSVDTLHPLDNSSPNVTGGYMMKIDRLDAGESGFNAAGQTIAYVAPHEFDIATPQRAPQQQYLQSYMNAFGTALNGASYTNATNGFRAYLDQASWIDHHILNVVTFNVDALRLSAYFYKPRTNVLVFGPIWDFDRSQGSTDGRDYSPLYWRAPNGDLGTDFFNYTWWGRMFTDIDFWQAWIDRYEDLRAGALSTNHIYADIDALVAQVQAEEPREAARWPSLTAPRSGTITISGYSYTFPGTYQGEVNFLKKWYADRLNFMDTNFVAKPVFNNLTGAFTNGATLTLTAPGATIYYTTNGTDPRVSGGGVAANALIYTGAIPLITNVTITARAYNASHHNLTGANNPPLSSPWSGLASESFVPAAAPIITQPPADLWAYVGQNPVFTVQAAASPAPMYQWRLCSTNLAGQTNAQLTLKNVQASQAGIYSVSVSNLAGGTTVSALLTVTPKPHLVITEVMSSEAKGSLTTSDWWELSNLGNFAVNLQGYRFDDDHHSFSDAETITNAVNIAPGESIVLVEDLTPDAFRAWWGSQHLPARLQMITYPNIGFSSSGDAIYLWNAAANSLTDTVASVTFAAATRGVSFGFDPATGTFGGLSAAGQNGAFTAAANGDIGSPGTVLNPPQLAGFNFSGASGFILSFVTQSNVNYRVEYKDDLTAPAWTALTNFIAVGNLFSITDDAARTNSARFYRIVAAP